MYLTIIGLIIYANAYLSYVNRGTWKCEYFISMSKEMMLLGCIAAIYECVIITITSDYSGTTSIEEWIQVLTFIGSALVFASGILVQSIILRCFIIQY
jgi:hypothetical protein